MLKLNTNAISLILSCIPDLISAAYDLALTLLDTILNTDWFATGSQILGMIIDGLFSLIGSLASSAVEIASTLWNEITSIDWWSLGGDIISGIANGIIGSIGLLADAALRVARNALDTIKNALGIHSPSKVFAKEVGRFIPPGIGEGYDEAMPQLSADMRKQLMHTIDDANAAVANEIGNVNSKIRSTTAPRPANSDSSVITNDNGISIVIYYTGSGDPEDVKKIGRQIGTEAAKELRRRGLATV